MGHFKFKHVLLLVFLGLVVAACGRDPTPET